jgi:hypothetical protein
MKTGVMTATEKKNNENNGNDENENNESSENDENVSVMSERVKKMNGMNGKCGGVIMKAKESGISGKSAKGNVITANYVILRLS